MSTPSPVYRAFGAAHGPAASGATATPPQPTKSDPVKSFLWHLLAQFEVKLLSFMAMSDDDAVFDVADKAAHELYRVGLLAAFRHVKQIAGAPTLPPDPLIDVEDLQAVYDYLDRMAGLHGQNWDELHRAKDKLVELMKRGVK